MSWGRNRARAPDIWRPAAVSHLEQAAATWKTATVSGALEAQRAEALAAVQQDLAGLAR